MTPTGAELQELADVAVEAATAAGDLVARTRPAEVEHKAGGGSLASQVVTEVDRVSEALILEHLRASVDRFDLGVLTEERVDDGGRLTADAFWCVDPIDGTLPFVEGRPGYAVSIALVRRDGMPLIGVVHDPVEATTWRAVAGQGIARDGEPWVAPVRTRDSLAVFVDRSLLGGDDGDQVTAMLDDAATALGLAGVEINVGFGAVMNACSVLTAGPACYLKLPVERGGGSLWDFAATACLFGEAGAVATDLHGAPLDLNRPDSTFMNHRGVLFASDAAVATSLRSRLRGPV